MLWWAELILELYLIKYLNCNHLAHELNLGFLFKYLLPTIFYSSSVFTQIILQPQLNSEHGTPILKQEEIDAIQSPAEGFWTFNASTGCINYYLNGRWHELCGHCVPRPGRITQIVVVLSGNDYILYPKITGPCKKIVFQLLSETHEQDFRPGDSLRVASLLPVPSDSLELLIYPLTECGKGEDFRLVLKNHFPLKFGPILLDSLSGLHYRRIGSIDWMIEDYIPSSSFRRPLTGRPDIVMLKHTDNPCPTGWRLPSTQEWEILFKPFGENPQPLFEPPQDNNLGLGLSLANMYSSKENKILYVNEAGLYYTNKRDSKITYFLSPRLRGFIIIPIQYGEAVGGIRCVR